MPPGLGGASGGYAEDSRAEVDGDMGKAHVGEAGERRAWSQWGIGASDMAEVMDPTLGDFEG